ncbi:AGC family protein kinase-like protein, partial [Leptotrombidium deliense]
MSGDNNGIQNNIQIMEVGSSQLLHEMGFGNFGRDLSSSTDDASSQMSETNWSQYKTRNLEEIKILKKLSHKNIDHSNVKESNENFVERDSDTSIENESDEKNNPRNMLPQVDCGRRCLKDVIICYSTTAKFSNNRYNATAKFEFRFVIMKQIVDAIYYLHKNKYYHGDIRPQNIFLCENDVVKLGNFRSFDSRAANITWKKSKQDGMVDDSCVAPEIMRERLMGKNIPDEWLEKADVY